MTQTRNVVVIGLVLALVGVLLLAPARAGAVVESSRPGEIVVVTSNLKEAFDLADARDGSDMGIYVRRLMKQLPAAPDVLLLQEVRRVSVRKVVGHLRRVTGRPYAVAVQAGEPPWRERARRIVDRETAIVINAATMEVSGDSGRFTTRYPRSAAAGGEKVRVRHHSYAVVSRIDRSASVAVASVHYVQNRFFASQETGDDYKRRWVLETADLLDAVGPGVSPVVGGDFNATRGARDEWANHSHSPWLVGMTGDPYSFVDAVWEVTRLGGPDFIMTKAGVADAGLDEFYDPRRAKRDGYFYSDHRFRWALLTAF